jgi:hypothetical protein
MTTPEPAHRIAARAWLSRHFVGVWGTAAVVYTATALAGLSALLTSY